MQKFDVAIVGGGMVGAATALALANLGLTIAIIEKYLVSPISAENQHDLRVSAISIASEQFLQQLGAWASIKQLRTCVYKRLGVWEQNEHYLEFSAEEIGQPHLGHIVENKVIQHALWQQISNSKHITLFCPEALKELEKQANGYHLILQKSSLFAHLVIAADGGQSYTRKLANIGVTGWQYQQSCLLINVETKLPQQDITWQQFTPSGPVAMLPLSGHCASLVWYDSINKINQLQQLSNFDLQQAVLEKFPARLGRIKVLNKASFQLARQHANTYVKPNLLLIGDAAHTINPLAGQGVNLGFKDVYELTQVIANAIANGESWYGDKCLQNYQEKRYKDNLLMMSAMDLFYAGFSHPSALVKLGRNIALSIAAKSGLLKAKALKYACGIN